MSSHLAPQLIRYLNRSPSPYHAVASSAARLRGAGFTEVPFSGGGLEALGKGSKHFFQRDGYLVAFAVGGACEPGDHAFKVLGAHTDSPTLRVKPRSKRARSYAPSASAWARQLSVETYGGGLWHTWFDRDLSLAGRVVLRHNGSSDDDDDGDKKATFSRRLVHLRDPLLRVPTLAIHLQSAGEREAFAVNKEDHLQPVLCDALHGSLVASSSSSSGGGDSGSRSGSVDDWSRHQEPVLLSLLAKELGLSSSSSSSSSVESIVDFDLVLYDTQGAAMGGAHEEFINSARLDNLASCFVAVEALCEHAGFPTPPPPSPSPSSDDDDDDDDDYATLDSSNSSGASSPPLAALAEDKDVTIVALFDHEEVGSVSNTGAGSPVMKEAVDRISSALLLSSSGADGDAPVRMGMGGQPIFATKKKQQVEEVSENGNEGSGAAAVTAAFSHSAQESHRRALAKSMVLSVDMAHAVHPNYAAKHDLKAGDAGGGLAPVMNGGAVIKSNGNQRYATVQAGGGFLMREIGRRAGLPPLQEFAVRNVSRKKRRIRIESGCLRERIYCLISFTPPLLLGSFSFFFFRTVRVGLRSAPSCRPRRECAPWTWACRSCPCTPAAK